MRRVLKLWITPFNGFIIIVKSFGNVVFVPRVFNLPRQHSLIHYVKLIRAYGAPNGLCSSITESKHIKAVKEPWRRSNRYNALSQMLLTNQRLDKLVAARLDFTDRDMLEGTCLSSILDQILRTVSNCL
jgi:hypothetical protein